MTTFTYRLFSSEVRKPFILFRNARASKYIYAVLIDALDIFSNLINAILTAIGLGGVGLALDGVADILQTLLALIIFEDPVFSIANIDFILPQGFDIFPAYTSKIIASDIFKMR